MALKSIGIVGCGAIGRALLKAVEAGQLSVHVAGVTSRSEKNAREFLSTFKTPPPFLSLHDLIAASDLVVEAAGGSVVNGLAQEVFAAGKDLMVISVGALLDHPEIIEKSRQTGCRLYAPSGAIAGLDGIKSACVGEITHVTMTTRKPPNGLEGAPHLVRNGISVAGLTEEKEVFSGTVPGLKRNCHDIEIEGDFGRLHVHIENVPSENPKTGKLTAMSIIRAVQDVVDPVRIGN
jgi:aspartate dehydrogenase